LDNPFVEKVKTGLFAKKMTQDEEKKVLCKVTDAKFFDYPVPIDG
jgi:hypothetical protein